ncbi:hypothetical protein ACFLXN_02895 [Chloroflexota bacterium]
MPIGDEQYLLNHFNVMVNQAWLLLDGGLDKIQVNDDTTTDTGGYSSMYEGEPYEWTREELTRQLEENTSNAVDKWNPYEVIDCLVDHLQAEDDVYHSRDLYYLIMDNPLLVIKHLLALTQWETLKGTCPICEHWE